MTNLTLKQVERKRPRGQPSYWVWMLRWKAPDGKECGETLGRCSKMTRKTADAIKRKRQGELDCGVISPNRTKPVTLAELVEYDRTLIVDRRQGTQRNNAIAMKRLLELWGPNTRADQLGAADVARLKRAMIDRGLAPSTQKLTIATAHAMFARATKGQSPILEHNPLQGELKTDVEAKAFRVFSPDELGALLEVVPNAWWECFVRLLSQTGLRLNEAINLRWDDISLDGEPPIVNVVRRKASERIIDGASYPILSWSAKAKASYRCIPIQTGLAEFLRVIKARSKSPYLFVSLSRLAVIGDRVRAGTWREDSEIVHNVLRRFKTIQQRARELLASQRGVTVAEVAWETGRIHDLRHSYISHMAHEVPVNVLKRIAGHAKLETTLLYCHDLPTDNAAIVAALNASGLGTIGAQSGHKAPQKQVKTA